MFEKLQLIEERYEEISRRLMDPNIVADQNAYRDLMKEYKNLTPIVEKFRAYKKAAADFEEAKSLLDGISAIVFSSSLGIGVAFSAVAVLLYQGAITLLASLLAPVLSDAAVAEMTCAGSLLIVGIGLNLLGLTKLKLANYLPAVFLPLLLVQVL